MAAKNVDEYIKNAHPKAQKVLIELRELIKKTVPNAEEIIGYQMPWYRYKGMFVSFQAAKNHLSFYSMSPGIMKEFTNELKDYDWSGSTIRLPFDQPIPKELIKKIIKARVEENDKREIQKKGVS